LCIHSVTSSQILDLDDRMMTLYNFYVVECVHIHGAVGGIDIHLGIGEYR